MRQTFVGLLAFFSSVFVGKIKEMVPESQISQSLPPRSWYFLCVSVLETKLVSELNNMYWREAAGVSRRMSIWWYEEERIVLFVFCCSVFIMCVCISYVQGITDREVCNTSIYNISAVLTPCFFINIRSTKERCIALQGKHICLFGCNQISLPEIILFSVTSNLSLLFINLSWQ